MIRKIFLILFLGLIAICGPPSSFLFASANNTTTVVKKIYDKKEAGAITSITKQNQDLSWTKTVAAAQPALPEYKGNNKSFTLLPGDPFAKLLDIGFLYIETKYLKNTLIPGFGRRLHQEA